MASIGITERLARTSIRRPWLVVGIWVAALIVGGVFASGIGNVLTTKMTIGTQPESVRGRELLEQRLEGPETGHELVVVGSRDNTVDDAAYRTFVENLVGQLRGLDGVVTGASSYYDSGDQSLVSGDRHETLIRVALASPRAEAEKNASPFLDLVKAAGGRGGFNVTTAGDASIQNTFSQTAERDLRRGEEFSIPVALVVLLVVFGAAVAAGIPLLVGLVAIVVAVGAAALIGRAFELSFFVVNMIMMIGLAVGVDYSLFIIHRWREERSAGHDVQTAIARAAATASRAVLFSGGTVIVGLAGLFIIPSNVYRSLAIGAIAVAAFAVLASLTLLPAVLALLGDRVNALQPPLLNRISAGAGARRGHGFWDRVARLVMARPLLSAGAAVVLLLVMAVPFLTIRTGTAGVATMPPDSPVRRAFGLLDRDFSGGMIAPAQIVIDGPAASARSQAAQQRLLASLRGDQEFGAPSVRADEAGDLTLIAVPLAGDPQSDAAHAAIGRLRDRYIPAAFAGAGVRVYVSGTTAESHDMFALFRQYTPYVFAFVLGLSFVLLLLMFRSIVVPAKAIIMNLLSVGAAYGLLVLVFQKGVGAHLLGFQQTDTIEAWLPLFLFTVLFGLSMDYHVFLLSRIREKFDETGDSPQAIVFGMTSTSGLITGAALIMVTVFAGFALGNLSSMQQMGFGLAVAVTLDATIVRSILVPASMQLLGDLNWYLPGWLQWLPKVEVEGRSRVAAQPSALPVMAA